MAGTALGDTNDPASMRPTPVFDSASTRRMRASTGSGASLCNPSRGPTSRTSIDAGSSTGTSTKRSAIPETILPAAPHARLALSTPPPPAAARRVAAPRILPAAPASAPAAPQAPQGLLAGAQQPGVQATRDHWLLA